MPAIDKALIFDWLYNNFGNAFNTAFQPQLTQNTSFAKWLAGQQPRYENQYAGQVANQGTDSAGMPFNAMNFLTGLTNQYTGQGDEQAQTAWQGWGGVNPMAEWLNMAPSQRGERPGQFAPPVTWKSLFGSR